MSYQTLTTERRGGVCVVRYEHGPRNFMCPRLLLELRLLMVELENDASVRVIVFTSAHPDNFMIAYEVPEALAMTQTSSSVPRFLHPAVPGAVRAVSWLLRRVRFLARWTLSGDSEAALRRNALLNMILLFDQIERSSKVTIAAINGSCFGGGLELALCFDLRVMCDGQDTVIGQPEVLVGLVPGFGATQRLSRLLGPARALDLQLTGGLLSAAHAERIGLVSYAFAPEEYWQQTLALAERLALRAPRAVAGIKRAVRLGSHKPLRPALSVELREVMRVAGSDDTRRGLEAFNELIVEELGRPATASRTMRELHTVLDAGIVEFHGR